jgi:hypothetical protein
VASTCSTARYAWPSTIPSSRIAGLTGVASARANFYADDLHSGMFLTLEKDRGVAMTLGVFAF